MEGEERAQGKDLMEVSDSKNNGQDLSLNSCQRQDSRLCGELLPGVTRWGDPPGEVTSQECVCRHGRACGRAVATPLGGTQTHHILISPLGKGIVPGMVRLNVTEFVLRVAKFEISNAPLQMTECSCIDL